MAAQDYSSLLAVDQLRNEQRGDRVFCDFVEANPQFAPTYRYRRR
jgi:hypothetical protein